MLFGIRDFPYLKLGIESGFQVKIGARFGIERIEGGGVTIHFQYERDAPKSPSLCVNRSPFRYGCSFVCLFHLKYHNRPLAIRGHVTNASFKQ